MPGGRFSHLIYPAHLEIRRNSHLKVMLCALNTALSKNPGENTEYGNILVTDKTDENFLSYHISNENVDGQTNGWTSDYYRASA